MDVSKKIRRHQSTTLVEDIRTVCNLPPELMILNSINRLRLSKYCVNKANMVTV